MKIALITDTHFGARNDSLIFSDFFRKFYENVFFPTLKERGITDVIHLGDVVDRRKFINYKTLNSMKEILFVPLKEMGGNIKIIVGNHDIYYKNSDFRVMVYDFVDTFEKSKKKKAVKKKPEPTTLELFMGVTA